MPRLPLPCPRRRFAVALCALAVACGPGAVPADEGIAREESDARTAARRDAERMVRDVHLETLEKRVDALELELEQIKARQSGVATLDLEKRLAAVEERAVPAAPPPAATPQARAPAAEEPARAKKTPPAKAPATRAQQTPPARPSATTPPQGASKD